MYLCGDFVKQKVKVAYIEELSKYEKAIIQHLAELPTHTITHNFLGQKWHHFMIEHC
jgi:hypothetical protein